jgi:hypothetical protein
VVSAQFAINSSDTPTNRAGLCRTSAPRHCGACYYAAPWEEPQRGENSESGRRYEEDEDQNVNKNPGAPNDDIERLKMRKEVLWGLFEEHRAHARHIETLRSAVISMLIVASAVLATLSTYDKKLNTSDLPAAGLLVGFGILGTVFSFYHTEKITKHNM